MNYYSQLYKKSKSFTSCLQWPLQWQQCQYHWYQWKWQWQEYRWSSLIMILLITKQRRRRWWGYYTTTDVCPPPFLFSTSNACLPLTIFINAMECLTCKTFCWKKTILIIIREGLIWTLSIRRHVLIHPLQLVQRDKMEEQLEDTFNI